MTIEAIARGACARHHTPAIFPPTGKRATVPASTTLEIKNGKIVGQRVYSDMTTLLGQLGLMPPM